jgi:transposase
MAGSVSRPFFLEERLGSSGPAIEARLWHRVDRANRENRAQTQDGRKLRRYQRSWCVERLFAWLQWFRRLVTRYEYHIENFLGMVRLGCMRIMLRYL